MRSTIYRKVAFLPLLALALAPFAPASAAISVRNSAVNECQAWNFETDANGLLKEIKSLSAKLNNEATTLESYKRQPQLSWQSHANQLTRAKEHINAIGERLNRLQAIKSVVAPWQQHAIEQIVPVAAKAAAHTEAAIVHLNENGKYLFAPVYGDHLTSISDHSEELKASVNALVEFGETSDKVDRVQQKLNELQERIGLSES
jgi:chromosome segregation ATPase